jgi:hypothetical protein
MVAVLLSAWILRLWLPEDKTFFSLASKNDILSPLQQGAEGYIHSCKLIRTFQSKAG